MHLEHGASNQSVLKGQIPGASANLHSKQLPSPMLSVHTMSIDSCLKTAPQRLNVAPYQGLRQTGGWEPSAQAQALPVVFDG